MDANWKTTTMPSLVFILITIHLIRRVIETRYISIFSPASKMGIIHFLSGIIFYASLAICCHNLDISSSQDDHHHSSLNIIVGVIVFIIGQLVQFDSHKILASLRKTSDKIDKHSIPSGHLFNSISCPNYFTEILIYIGLLIVTNFDASMFALTFWVMVNQFIAAKLSHVWYMNYFKDTYPQDRKAIIPYIL